MAMLREVLARVLMVFAIAAASASLGMWWASLLVIKTAGTLNASAASSVSRDIGAQLDKIAPGTTKLPGVEQDIKRALADPAVTQQLASSAPKGSAALSSELAQLDSRLGSVLSGGTLLVDAGQHDLATLARDLRSGSKFAAIFALIAAAVALAISPLRHLILRHLAFGAATIGGLAVFVTWAIPALVGHFTKGGARHDAMDILSAGSPVRSVLLECFIIGAAVYVATHLFELVGGRRIAYDNSAGSTPQGRVA